MMRFHNPRWRAADVPCVCGCGQMDAVPADNSRDAQESTGAKHIEKEHTGEGVLQQGHFTHAV